MDAACTIAGLPSCDPVNQKIIPPSDHKPRMEKIGCRARSHKISEALVSGDALRSRVAQTLMFVDTFPRLSAIRSTGSHFLQVTVTLANKLTS